MTYEHIPVLYHEVLKVLDLQADDVVLDATCGGGGHSSGILAQLGPNSGQLVCLDKDPAARKASSERLTPIAEERGVPLHILAGDFGNLDEALAPLEPFKANKIFADIGVSSPQIDDAARGFSYHEAGPLDMRMNPEQPWSCADLLATASQKELKRIISNYGEERYAGRIASMIVKRQKTNPFKDSLDLAESIANAVPASARRGKHPARRTFQALRIAVNDELGALERFLTASLDRLEEGGIVAVISFHSLEDRIVKQTFRKWEDPCECPRNLPCVCGLKPYGKILKRRGWVATDEEAERNPRSRSARLRAFQKGGTHHGESEA